MSYAADRSRADDGPKSRVWNAPHRAVVLLVEDDTTLLMALAAMLERNGYRVLRAAGADEARHIARTFPFPIDALVADAIMPETNGVDLVREIQQYREGIKLLIVSGYDADSLSDRGFSCDDLPILAKPFSTAKLAATIAELLEAEPVG